MGDALLVEKERRVLARCYWLVGCVAWHQCHGLMLTLNGGLYSEASEGSICSTAGNCDMLQAHLSQLLFSRVSFLS